MPIFNPGSNRHQVSWLRVANLGDTRARVTIRGQDDAGRAAPGGEVELTLPAHGAWRVSAQALESGAAGLSGRFGDGAGKWRLAVSADAEIEVVSLLASPTGHLSNLSTTPRGAPPSTGDGNDTIAEAVDLAVGTTVPGRIDAVGDVDYYRIDVAHAGTLVVWTSGEVATELELLDAHGSPLASALRPSAARASAGASAQVPARASSVAPNFTSKEYEVRRGRYTLTVGHKLGVGGYNVRFKNVRVGMTNVNTDQRLPSLNVQTGVAGVSVDLAPYIRNPDRIELRWSATVENPARLGAIPVKVGVTFSGSVMTILGEESGPAYSGPITIKVRVSDLLGLLHAELEFPIQFTREEQPDTSGGLGCVNVEVTPFRDTAAECRAFFGGGIKYGGEFTNNCRQPVYVKYEWSRFGNDSPRPTSGLSGPIGPGGTSMPFSTLCISGAAPELRTCAFYSDFSNDHLCRDF